MSQNYDAAQADALRQQEQNRQMELQRKLQEVQDQIKRYEQQTGPSRYARVLLLVLLHPGQSFFWFFCTPANAGVQLKNQL
jgi:hypothetical protein